MHFIRKVGRRGILTLPSEVREIMEINEGDIVEFELLAVVRRAPKSQSARSTQADQAVAA